jgi:hypothetical protein
MARFDLLGGGAIGRVPADATAFVHRSALFAESRHRVVGARRGRRRVRGLADGYEEALRGHPQRRGYQNYAQAGLADWAAATTGRTIRGCGRSSGATTRTTPSAIRRASGCRRIA